MGTWFNNFTMLHSPETLAPESDTEGLRLFSIDKKKNSGLVCRGPAQASCANLHGNSHRYLDTSTGAGDG